MQSEEKKFPDAKQKEEETIPQETVVKKPHSRESLWGALLFACMILFVVASMASIGWFAYAKWKTEKVATMEPSIAVLSEKIMEQQTPVEIEGAKASGNDAEEVSPTDITVAAKKLPVSVLNGGATKGSAGTVATFLKAEGYTNVTAGNTLKDYSGVVLYYATGLEKEAEAVRVSVAKKYPQAKSMPADTTNKETTVSQVTIILGK